MKLNLLTIAFVVVGIIHTLPLVGIMGASRLQALYGLNVSDPNLLVLLQHRAVLFGTVAMVMYAAAFNPSLHALAIAIAIISMASFIILVLLKPEINAALTRVAWVDVFALVVLLLGLLSQYWVKSA